MAVIISLVLLLINPVEKCFIIKKTLCAVLKPHLYFSLKSIWLRKETREAAEGKIDRKLLYLSKWISSFSSFQNLIAARYRFLYAVLTLH